MVSMSSSENPVVIDLIIYIALLYSCWAYHKVCNHHKLDGKENAIRRMLLAGLSQRKIAKKLKVGPTTINTFVKNNTQS